jgi:putative nucleotidyltransferase with HDIG domain
MQVRGKTAGIYSVALPTDFIFSAGSTTRTQVAVLFGVGIIAVLGIGFFLAGALTKPILRLVQTAAVVSSGDLNARSGVHTSDEIGQLARSFDSMTARLQKQHLATIRALTSAIDARDPYTLGHSVRVGQLAVTIGRRLELPNTLIGHLETGGYLHDIGKIGIRDAVLGKPGALTPEERALIDDHPRIGLKILEAVELPGPVIEFVGSHHERLDGSGYPQGLSGEEISLVPRIAAVADMYDAITTDRPYREAMTPEQAMHILHEDSRKFLDPDVVRAMRDVLETWERRRLIEPELRGYRRKMAAKQLV